MATRTLPISIDAHVVQTPDSGAGADDHLNVGLYSTYLHRSLLKFILDFSDVVTITAATLHMRSNTAHGTIGASPSFLIQRATSAWSEGTVGTAEDFSSANAVKWSNQPTTTATGQVSTTIGGTSETWYSVSILDIVQSWFGGSANHGLLLKSNNEASATARTSFYSRESAYDPYITITYTTNARPTAPSSVAPGNGAVVNTLQPLLDWTHNDPEADAQTAYEIQLATDSAFAAMVWNPTVSSSTSSATTPVLTRGVTYYWRVKTSDAGGFGPWGITRSFTVASLPTVSITLPSADGVAAPLYYTAGSDTQPKLKVTWTMSCAQGGTQDSATIRVYNTSDVLQHTHAHSGSSGTALLSGYSPAQGASLRITVQSVCSHGATSVETIPADRDIRVRWGRASYRADLTVAPTTLSASTASTANSGQVIVEYASSAAATPEPTDWKATIAEVTKQRYIWHRVTLLPEAVATPTSPAFNSVTFTYSNTNLTPDNWTLWSGATVDTGTFVYGTQSLRQTGDGITARHIWQEVPVVPNTDYVLSGRLKSQGVAWGVLRILDDTGTATLASVNIPNDTDWARYATPVFNTGEATAVRVSVRIGSTSGAVLWSDALKLEASRVVTPWTPGFLGTAVVLDAGGVMVDAAAGGIFRLRDSSSHVTHLDELVGLGVGRLTYAPRYLNTQTFGSALALAASGGSLAMAIPVPSPMYMTTLRLWSTDTANLRTAEARLYLEDSAGVLREVPGATWTFSFTPTVASIRSATASGSPVWLKSGTYFLVIRNTSATETFGVGHAGVNAAQWMGFLGSVTQTGVGALASTIDISGWGGSGAHPAVVICGTAGGRSWF